MVNVAALGGPGAVREAAGLVAGDDMGLQVGGGLISGAAVVEEPPVGRVVQDPPPGAVGGDPPGHVGGDRPVPGQLGRVVVQSEEGGRGDGDTDVGAPAMPGRQAGADGPLTSGEEVRADLVQAVEPAGPGQAVIACTGGPVGQSCQGGVDGGHLGGGADHLQFRHPVGQRPHVHAAFGSRLLVGGLRGGRVSADDRPGQTAAELPDRLPGRPRQHPGLHRSGLGHRSAVRWSR